jgi:hypothetical protein
LLAALVLTALAALALAALATLLHSAALTSLSLLSSLTLLTRPVYIFIRHRKFPRIGFLSPHRKET